jgi:indolepyruvate ferredoxin oxidoreductase
MTSTAELSSPSSANTSLTNSVVDPDYTLEHKYSRVEGRIYLSGVQALVRLPSPGARACLVGTARELRLLSV